MNSVPTRTVCAFFGPPGSGKGTQSDKLQAYFESQGLPVITMGAGGSLRALQAEKPDSVLAQMARDATSQGVSVAGALVTHFWIAPLLDVSANQSFVYFVDGPCRVNHESQLFVEFVKSLNAKLYVIEFELSDEICLERMINRAHTENRADDANIDTMKKRISVYRDNTTIALENLLHYMSEVSPHTSKHVLVDARPNIENVFEQLVAELQ